MKGLFLFVLVALAAFARCNEALILISPDDAGPSVDEQFLVHGEWILWPAQSSPGSSNRLLSLLSGMDWDASGSELIFAQQGGRWLSTEFTSLNSRGYFVARDQVVPGTSEALLDRSGLPDPVAMLLALDGRSPEPGLLRMSDPWPPGALIVARAQSWDEVAAISAKAGGRVLVAEYPPPLQKRRSRLWLRGSGWSSRLPTWPVFDVPGLIPASAVGRLLLQPTDFRWQANETANEGGANRWLAFIGYTSPLCLSILAFIAIFFAGCTVYLISREEHARVAGTTLKYLTLLPATVLVAGSATRQLGYSFFWLWLLGCFVVLVLCAQALGGIMRRAFPRAHSMLAIAVVGLVASLASSPLWSMYSNVLNVNVLPLPPEAAGALLAYLTGVCAFSRGAGAVAWIGPIGALLVFAWGIAAPTWWVAGVWPFVLLPIVALVAGEGWFRAWALGIAVVTPLADFQVIRHGFVWAPGGLFGQAGESSALNLARHVEFLISFGFVCTAVTTGAVAVFVERYFFHELRRTLMRDTRVKALFHASFLAAAMGVFQPLMLYPALMCFVGGAFVLLSDSARAA